MDGLTLGLLICYDVEFPEAVRHQVLAGADLIVVPTALSQPHDFVAQTLIPTRAYENQCFIAYVNHSGVEGVLNYCGKSVIAAPDGESLARAGQDETLLIADINPEDYAALRRQVPYLRDRRADLYDLQ